jgi:RNA polymerase sigma-70 factor (subfamily 1)
MESDPRRLVAAATQGDAAAIDALLVRHLPGLRGFIERRAGARIREKESCSDLVQTVCREALENIGNFRYRDENGFKQWLYSAALNKIQARARYYRAGKRDAVRERPLPDDGTSTGGGGGVPADSHTPSRHVAAREDLSKLNDAFSRLPDEYREVIVLSRELGLPHAEIAKRLSRSEPAVRVLLARALARLIMLASET